jgi:hypothetical protein
VDIFEHRAKTLEALRLKTVAFTTGITDTQRKVATAMLSNSTLELEHNGQDKLVGDRGMGNLLGYCHFVQRSLRG